MLISQVICVTYCTGFPIGTASFTELLCWCGTVSSALPQLCRPVSTLVGRQALRSSSGGKFLVLRVNTSTMQRRAFSVRTFYLEFTSLADSIVTKELHAFHPCRFGVRIVLL